MGRPSSKMLKKEPWTWRTFWTLFPSNSNKFVFIVFCIALIKLLCNTSCISSASLEETQLNHVYIDGQKRVWWSKAKVAPSDHQQRPVQLYGRHPQVATSERANDRTTCVTMCERLARGLRNRSVESIVLSQKPCEVSKYVYQSNMETIWKIENPVKPIFQGPWAERMSPSCHPKKRKPRPIQAATQLLKTVACICI